FRKKTTPRTRKKNATPKRPTKSGVRGRGTYTGRRGAARGNGGAGVGDPGVAEVAGAASVPAVVKEAPQYRQKREVSLFIVPQASQRIAQSRARIREAGLSTLGRGPLLVSEQE